MITKDYLNEFNSPIRKISGKVEVYASTSSLEYTFTHTDALQSIEIDRAGEPGKFFGFGIGQKATIKLVDKDRLLTIGKDNYLKIDFRLNENDFVGSLPTYFVSEAKRDENTNGLTITASDSLEKMNTDTVSMIHLTSYTIREFAAAASSLYGLSLEIQGVEDNSFDTEYPEGANFEGTEKIRTALNAVAEATQTIYFISGDKLIFKRLNLSTAADLTIEKQHYFTLDSKEPHTLGAVCHATELGDNVISPSLGGDTQYVRDNPFWELRDDIATLVNNAATAIAGITITPFTCSWRGNFLLEPGDKIEIVAKDNTTFVAYALNDKMTYSGGFSQTSEWSYDKENETASNPSTLGEALKQTFAKVDKVNKQIDMVVSETGTNKDAISTLQLTTNGINASVSTMEKTVKENADAVSTLSSKVDAQITADDVTLSINKALENGVGKVETSTGFTFNDEGLTVSKSGSEISTQITEDGMNIKKGYNEVLTASNEGVKAQDLHATTYLIIGKNSRFEDMGNRTACFWIGGNN
jgi:hypothetical protein